VPGWLVAAAEDAVVAKDFLARAVAGNGATPPHTVHADRGGAMVSKPVSDLLTDLGVLRSHSRPRTSNDNPYSEAQFKTMKYVPDFPEFGSLQDARAFCEGFFLAYNHEHRHSGIGLHTPASVHFGTAEQIHSQRQATLNQAYGAHPQRFARRPRPPALPKAAWINEPIDQPQPTQ
jgi:putative transposase